MTSEEQPKLHVDSDWKAQAQAEKERLDREAEATAEKREKTRPGELPEADFKSLVGLLASQAIMYLGAYGDPKTGRVMVDLNGAQFSIDLLDVLEEKTKGNVSDDEANEVRQVVAELRNRYVQVSKLISAQGTASPEMPGGTPIAPPSGA